MYNFEFDPRFKEIKPFDTKLWLASPTMHGDELTYITEAYNANWVSTSGENIEKLEELVANIAGVKYAVALSSGTAALHMSVKLAAEKLYGSSTGISTPAGLGHGGSLYGRRVFCSDMTFSATVNPVVYEGGEPIFVDTEYDTWNMNPNALKRAFEIYPEVKVILIAHLYGTPGKMDEIKSIADQYKAIIIEDAAEAFGATYKGIPAGAIGDYGCISFNGNKIITGSSGGIFLTDNLYDAEKVRKWSTQSRENASWYQHEEIGYNYRMSNIIAGIVRGQCGYLKEHIKEKKRIYERYREKLKNLPGRMNPFEEKNSEPNYWLSCFIINSDAMAAQVRGEKDVIWTYEKGKSSPTEILDALKYMNVEGRPIWKPMHMQPFFRNHAFVTEEGLGRANSNAYIRKKESVDVGSDIFNRGLCLPSDIKMTIQQQDLVVEIIHRCFA